MTFPNSGISHAAVPGAARPDPASSDASAVALEQRRIADLEAQGIYVRRLEWVCNHGPRLPVDLTKVHPHQPIRRLPQYVRGLRPWKVSA